MEAGSRPRRFCLSFLFGLLATATSLPAQAADQRSRNFIVQAPTPGLANAVADAAERYRRDLAIHWLGQELPPWPTPCPIRVVAGPNLAAQGVTTYNPAPVRDFQMEVVGTPERILDSVLPHEVTHTILATYFGRPLPRWADEGICTTVEHASERGKHEVKLREFLRSRRGIAMNQLFLMTEYPNDVLPLYAQGYSVCRFLIAQKGPRTFIAFLQDYMRHPSWTANVKKHYQYDSLRELQDYWLAWVDAGSQDVARFAKATPAAPRPDVQLAAQSHTPRPPANHLALNDPRGASAVAQASGAQASVSEAYPRAPKSIWGRPESDSKRGSTPVPPQRLAALTAPGGHPPAPAGDAVLASTTADGWYTRRREGVLNRGDATPRSAAPAQPAAKQLAPPSVVGSGRYSAAQPQPEQSISSGGQAITSGGAPLSHGATSISNGGPAARWLRPPGGPIRR